MYMPVWAANIGLMYKCGSREVRLVSGHILHRMSSQNSSALFLSLSLAYCSDYENDETYGDNLVNQLQQMLIGTSQTRFGGLW